MVAKEDWSAAMSSEIFREYVKNELIKEAAQPKSLTEAGMMPSMDDWVNYGITLKDLKEFKRNMISKAKINIALREMGYTTGQMAKFLGHDNVMDITEARDLVSTKPGFPSPGLSEIDRWIDQELENPSSNETLSFRSLAEDQVLNELEEFQNHVNSSPHLKRAFQKLQQKFATDPIYRSKTNEKFVEGVMLLDFQSEE